MKFIKLFFLLCMLGTTLTAINDDELKEIARKGNLRKIKNLTQENTHDLTADGVHDAIYFAKNEYVARKLVEKLVEIFSYYEGKKNEFFGEVLKLLTYNCMVLPQEKNATLYIIKHVFNFENDTINLLVRHTNGGEDHALKHFIRKKNLIMVKKVLSTCYKKPPSISILKLAAQNSYDITKCLLDNFDFDKRILLQVSKAKMPQKTRELFIPKKSQRFNHHQQQNENNFFLDKCKFICDSFDFFFEKIQL